MELSNDDKLESPRLEVVPTTLAQKTRRTTMARESSGYGVGLTVVKFDARPPRYRSVGTGVGDRLQAGMFPENFKKLV